MKNLEELKELIINERIAMLLLEQKKKLPKKTEEEIEITKEGERFLESLEEEPHQIMIQYIDQLIDRFGKDQIYLYKRGFRDGVNLINMLHQLNKLE